MQRTTILLFSILSYLFLRASAVHAAQLNLHSETRELGINQQFQVDLVLDTEGELVNAIEGKISFPVELLEFKEISDGSSIVNLWIEKPEHKNGEVEFAGITPGGYSGESGLIFTMFFETKQKGIGTIKILDARSLLNDSFGTEAKLQIKNYEVNISEKLLDSRFQFLDSSTDTNPPEPFTPAVARDKTIFDNQWFLVFATQDKGTGIDHYEVQESKKEIPKTEKWIVAESPYLLRDQRLRNYIFVKAVDKAENKRLAMLLPQGQKLWYENYLTWIIVISGIAIIFLVGRIIWKKYLKKSQKFYWRLV